MKKAFAVLLCLALAAGLCACGTDNPTPVTPEPAAVTDTDAQLSEAFEAAKPVVSGSDAGPVGLPELPASDTDAELDEAAYEAAQSYIGRPVEELYAELGEPAESQYAASCEEENAEDGMLFYEGGFYIWTLRTEEEELVRAVYLMD